MYSYFIHFPLTLTFWRLSLAQLVAVGPQGGATGVQYRIPWLEYFESAAAHFNGYCFRSLRKMSQENILSTRRDFFFFFLYKKISFHDFSRQHKNSMPKIKIHQLGIQGCQMNFATGYEKIPQSVEIIKKNPHKI